MAEVDAGAVAPVVTETPVAAPEATPAPETTAVEGEAPPDGEKPEAAPERTFTQKEVNEIAAKRARQINAYYSQLGEGLLEYVGPLVETTPQEKPLSIAMREINSGLLTAEPTEG
jgi:DNA-directed RNA polymerase subunit omega